MFRHGWHFAQHATRSRNHIIWLSALHCSQTRGRPRLSLEVAKEIATLREGTCLSDQYVGALEHLRWQCAKGHKWNASLNSVKDKQTWCPYCAGNVRLSIDEAIAVAVAKGGKCLSNVYKNSLTHLRWQCAQGHEWKATLNSIKNNGTWCPACRSVQGHPPLDLLDAAKAAAIQGGRCLSVLYVNARTPMHWQCSEGHTWMSPMQNVRKGSWCPKCAIARRRLNLAVAVTVAAARGGLCLSSKYIDARTHLLWRCSKGHEWHATMTSVKDRGSWCPECATRKNERDVRDIFQAIFHGFNFPTCRPTFLRGHKGRALELDGYCAALQLAFEYQGEQHYDRNSYWNQRRSDLEFEELITRDGLKVSLCEAFNIRLVVVPCMVKDRWNFIRLSLLRWFPVSTIFPTALPKSVLE